MNWGEIGTQVILGVLGIVLSALGVLVTSLINKFVKSEEAKKIASSLNDLVKDSVLEVYQTYVEALKDKNMFDKDAQKKALERCLKLINTNMPSEVSEWLKANYSNAEGYLKTLIEANIALLKNNAKKGA